MTADDAVSLLAQRQRLRECLGLQRARIARQLGPPAVGHRDGSGFPRSATMRLLLREPELVTDLLRRVAGTRVANLAPTALILIRLLGSTVP